jgi:TIR domain
MADRDRPSVRSFVSYARADTDLVERFLGLLRPRCQILRDVDVSLWWDRELLVGEAWAAELDQVMATAPVGLFLVTPNFLASEYVTEVELPRYLHQPGRVVVPVGLRRVDLRLADTKGLSDLQMYIPRPSGRSEGRWFSECGGENAHRFVDGLVDQLVTRITKELLG